MTQTQRERLTAAMVAVTARDGYPGGSVADVIAYAGVSRATFYANFRDRQACLLAALEGCHAIVLQRVRAHLEAAPRHDALAAAVAGIVETAAEHPAEMALVSHESLAGGVPALEAREEMIEAIATAVADAHAQLDGEDELPDVSPAIVVGGVLRLLSQRGRRGEAELDGVAAALAEWVDSYRLPGPRRRRIELAGLPAPRAPGSRSPLVRPPVADPSRVSAAEMHENRRQRLVLATAELIDERGYSGATVAAITRRAGVAHGAFRRLFADKEAAFMAVLELYFQHVMAVTASAFFAAEQWPQRIWDAAVAFAGCMDEHRTLARVSFIDSHSAGPATAQRVEELVNAFTLFLQEGYSHPGAVRAPSQLALDAVAAANFELVYHQARRGLDTAPLLSHFTHLALAPFLGASAADDFIERQMAAAAL